MRHMKPYKYLLIGAGSVMLLAVFVRATADSTSNYFSFLKNGSQEQNVAAVVHPVYAVKLPASANFAGEPIPLDDPEIRERLDRELTVNTYWHSSTIFLLKRANRFFPVIEPILKEEGVPDDMKYIVMAESGFENVVSPAGAAGFWQFLKSTGALYGLVINAEVDERYNLEKATRAACKYFIDAKNKTGSWTAAAASYNMGTAGILKQQTNQQETAYYNLFLNSETSRYVQRIVALKTIHQDPKDFGFNLQQEDLYQPYKYTTEVVDSAVSWVNFAKQRNISYKMLRIYNPWIRDLRLYNKERRTFTVKIPS